MLVPQGSLLTDRVYDTYFFKVVKNIVDDIDSWKWIYYRVGRKFSTHLGFFQNIELSSEEIPKNISVKNFCLQEDTCVGYMDVEDNQVILTSLNLDNFTPSKLVKTHIKINTTETSQISGKDAFADVNTCCPEPTEWDPSKAVNDINDTVERIPCNISRSKFFQDYVARKIVVILTNCTNTEEAKRKWTREYFFSSEYKNSLWDSGYDSDQLRSGARIQEQIRNNETVKVFDRIKRRYHMLKRRYGNRTEDLHDKIGLLEDYSIPIPLPDDLYSTANLLNDYQFININTINTGNNTLTIMQHSKIQP